MERGRKERGETCGDGWSLVMERGRSERGGMEGERDEGEGGDLW